MALLSQQNSKISIENDIDNIYLNIVMTPPPLSTDEIVATYDQHLTRPVLDDCSKYYCSIIRFTIPLDNIPILIFPIDTTQTNALLSPLIIGINYLDVNYPENVAYQPVNSRGPPTPNASPPYFTNGQLTDYFYWIYSITSVINMFNTALMDAVTAAGLAPDLSPMFSFDPVTELISLIVPANFLVTGATIYFNSLMQTFLSSFNLYYMGNGNPQGRDYDMVLNPLPPDSPVGGPYTFTEDYVSINLWFTLRKI